VIRKHPDVKWARTEEDFLRVPERQLRLLEGLAPFLKKGGIMVYATCSLEPEENEQIIERFLQSHPEFMLEDPAKVLSKTCPEKVKELCVENKYLRTFPHKHGLDGFFAVRLRKV
jgi:16S rRNA (cytosine967-C5)-methyltransferase